MEWQIRHFLSGKKVALSLLFYTQSVELKERNMKNLSYYSYYYSLFNALLSNIILLPYLPYEKVLRISHTEVFKNIENYFVKKNIYSEKELKLLSDLKLARELYSYKLPLYGKIFEERNFEEELKESLEKILKVSNLLSFLSEKAWIKKGINIEDNYNEHSQKADELFFLAIEERDYLGKRLIIDDYDYINLGKISKINPIPLECFIEGWLLEDFECAWDEFMDEGYEIESIRKMLDIIKF